MVRKICLDSDILIQLLKKDEKTIAKIRSLDAEFYTTAINTFEIWSGRTKEELISSFFNQLNVLNLDKDSSLVAGNIRRELKRTGKIIDIRDIFIASVCISNRIPLLTINNKHFERLKKFGLKLE